MILFQVRIAMVGKYTGLSDSYLSVVKVSLISTIITFFYLLNYCWCLIVELDEKEKKRQCRPLLQALVDCRSKLVIDWVASTDDSTKIEIF
jgi:CTP synthase (UTP-ammonia lyase)